MDSSFTLYTEPNVFDLSFNNDILTLTILENKFTDESSQKLIENIDLFHKISAKYNKQFYSLVDLTNASLLNVHNYIYYAPSLAKYLNSQQEFLIKHLFGTLYIINSNIVKKSLNLLLSHYTVKTHTHFILKDEPIDFSFTT